MAKKKQTKTEKHKESLLRQVRRMEAKGYWFDGDIRKEIKALSPQKARFFTTDTLYKKSKAAYADTGEIISGEERRKIERQERARKAAQTKYEKHLKEWKDQIEQAIKEAEEPKKDFEFITEEVPDITDDIFKNFKEFLDFLEGPPEDNINTKAGKNAPKPADVYVYDKSVKKFLQHIFEQEKKKDPEALAKRLLDNYSEIDELMGVVEYAGYKDAIRLAANAIARILRGTSNLSNDDRDAAENAANATEGWDDE